MEDLKHRCENEGCHDLASFQGQVSHSFVHHFLHWIISLTNEWLLGWVTEAIVLPSTVLSDEGFGRGF